MPTANKTSETYELGFIRVYNNPVEKVWKAWEDTACFLRRQGRGCLISDSIKIDFQEKGGYSCSFRSPEGQDIPIAGTFIEIIPMKRITYTRSYYDEKAREAAGLHFSLHRSHNKETIIGVTFEEVEGRTRVIVRETGVPEDKKQKTAEDWNEALERLAEIFN